MFGLWLTLSMPWPLCRSGLTVSSVIIMAVTFQLQRKRGASGALIRAPSLSVDAWCLPGAILCVSFQSPNGGVGTRPPAFCFPSIIGPITLEFCLKRRQNILDYVFGFWTSIFLSFLFSTGLDRVDLPLPFSVGLEFLLCYCLLP